MGRTKRDFNCRENKIVEQLKEKIIKGKKNDVSFIPSNYISRKDAYREHKLTSTDLQKLDNLAVLGEKRGVEGIFYPVNDIRMLKEEKAQTLVGQEMIQEATILKQIPKSQFPPGFLTRVRRLAVRGTRKHHKGRPTFFYDKDVVEQEFSCEVIPPEFEEGVDYIRHSTVSKKMRGNLINAKMSIWSDPSSGPGKAELCFFGRDVDVILYNNWYVGVTARRSQRIKSVEEK